VDCLDALTSDRQYRRSIPLDEAMREVVSQAGKQFDPRVVEVLQRRYLELEHLARAGSSSAEPMKLFTDIKIANRCAPGAGFEKIKTGASKGNFLASIVAARYEAQALLEFSIALGRSLSLYETLSVVAARLRKLVPYDTIAIYLLRGDKLVPEYVTGDDFRVFASLEIPLGEGLSGWVAQNRTPIVNGKSVGRTRLSERSAESQLHGRGACHSAHGQRRRRFGSAGPLSSASRRFLDRSSAHPPRYQRENRGFH
jgi:hypothetical protein